MRRLARGVVKTINQMRREMQDRIDAEMRRIKKEREWLLKDDDRETNIEVKFVSRMLDAGYMHLKADRIRRGWADQIFFGKGPRTIIVEFKRRNAPKDRKGEKLQDHFRGEFKERDYEVYKVMGWAEATALFKAITGQELRP